MLRNPLRLSLSVPLCGDAAARIIEGFLYLGSVNDAVDFAKLDRLGITNVLSVAIGIPQLTGSSNNIIIEHKVGGCTILCESYEFVVGVRVCVFVLVYVTCCEFLRCFLWLICHLKRSLLMSVAC